MQNTKSIVFITSLLLISSPLALARGGSGSGGSATGPSSHSQAAANSNGRFSSDRDTGQDRAGDRKSDEGMKHGKAKNSRKKGEPSDDAATRATPATPAVPGGRSSTTTPATPASPAQPANK